MATGLLEWSNAIRFTMANDPGRQVFHDQINTHGFVFLNDYLDNILSGAKQGPLIDLVKTPGRKKHISKKPKLASKLNHIITLDEEGDTKENQAPINNFHKALLEAKNATPPLRLPIQQGLRDHTGDSLFSPAPLASVPEPLHLSSGSEGHDKGSLAPAHLEQIDLSVIAEDDENPESSRVSTYLENPQHITSYNQVVPSEPAQTIPPPEYVSSREDINMAGSSSDTFHSITLDSPQPQQRPEEQPAPTLVPPPSLISKDTHLTLREQPANAHQTSLLPELPQSHIHADHNGALDTCIPLRDRHEEVPSSPKSLDNNFNVASYPALPAPVPLRKSMRAPRDPSMGAGPLGAVTPGAPPGGKRTSWLKKAREVKALETTGRIVGATAPLAPSTSSGLKRKSGDLLNTPAAVDSEDGRRSKSAKNDDDDVAPLKSRKIVLFETKDMEDHATHEPYRHSPQHTQTEQVQTGQEGILDRFKKTVEGLGARVGKSMGKSLGAGAAASALAEARAAAEARVAERNSKEDNASRVLGLPTPAPVTEAAASLVKGSPMDVDDATKPEVDERRLSVSDLFPPNDDSTKIKSKMGGTAFQFEFSTESSKAIAQSQSKASRESTTTTPPDSPPAARPASLAMPSGPVFNKPSPVFVPPAFASDKLKDVASLLPASTAFPIPAPISLGLGSVLPSSPFSKQPLSKQSTLDSLKSDAVFDDADRPAWMANTQDTEYSSQFNTQSQNQHMDMLDEDDSWRDDEKLPAGVQWTFGVGMGKEDSMTWSTLPSQSQRGDTGTSRKEEIIDKEGDTRQTNRVPGAIDVDMDAGNDDEGAALGDSDLEEMVMQGKSTVSLVEHKTSRSESQMSMVSSQSSQSQAGFLGQASKLLSSALGTSKKGKPEVKKVLQMAAVAAKKQQEENDKKAARLKEMENRRQHAIQRKAEEEKTRAQEQERKLKEEGERRKREREENTDKRPLKMAPSKKDEDNTKKRKVTVTDTEKKELKKPASKLALKSSMKQPVALGSSAAYNTPLHTATAGSSTSTSKQVDIKSVKPTPGTQRGKGKASSKTAPIPEDDLPQPSQLVQIQMAARAKAQLQAAHLVPEPVASESIELPECHSEYEDSEDEDRGGLPGWAQSPELREALQLQSTINPDDIFGAIRPLRMEELFKTRTSRFRARTSSANWTGSDRLTLEEEREYARRMGFK